MDIIKIFQDYSVRSADESDKHYRPGWVNTKCPFCTGNPGTHLGYNIQDNYFYCWRCGSHPVTKTLSAIIGIDFRAALKISKEYKGRSLQPHTKITVKRKSFMLPPMLKPLTKDKYGMKYMLRRGFTKRDLKILEKKFELFCAGAVSLFDDMDLCYRLIAPIKHKDKIVSWQSRDMTGASELKYLACPKQREVLDHKMVLYNEPEIKDTIILAEGIFDVWAIYLAGFKAITCFGVEYTYEQLQLLLKYKKVIIWMDPDKAGKKSSKRLMSQLRFAGIKSIRIKDQLEGDPAQLGKVKVRQILKGIK